MPHSHPGAYGVSDEQRTESPRAERNYSIDLSYSLSYSNPLRTTVVVLVLGSQGRVCYIIDGFRRPAGAGETKQALL